MTDEDLSTTDSQAIDQLLKLAGRRPMPDPARMAEARERARAEWRGSLEQRHHRSAWRLSLVAALIVGMVAVWTWIATSRSSRPPAPVEVATLQTVIDAMVVTSPDHRSQRVTAAGLRLHVGDRIETPTGGRAALRLNEGIAVRVDERTVAGVDAPDRWSLERGALYVDSGAVARPSTFHVRTALGEVRHLGTQFEVRVIDGRLRVRVREGIVALEQSGTRWISQAREELVVVPGKPPARQPLAIAGPDWNWMASLAAPPRVAEMNLLTFLDWATREQGLRWEFERPAMREQFARTIVHGSLEGLTPAEALEAVLPASGLTAHRDGDRLIVGPLPSK